MSMNNSKRRLHIELNRNFLRWCAKNEINVVENREVFFINESMLMKPEYVINGTIYVDVLKRGEFNEDNLIYYDNFANSFGTLIVIREEFIYKLEGITKSEINDKYSLNL